jgi:hypothetical protein
MPPSSQDANYSSHQISDARRQLQEGSFVAERIRPATPLDRGVAMSARPLRSIEVAGLPRDHAIATFDMLMRAESRLERLHR